MAIRKIVIKGEDVLCKKAKEVEEVDKRVLELLEDLADTMYKNNGVGLAAPQVGILKRVAVVDIGEGLIELINPRIIEAKGCILDEEGCLSIPGMYGEVERPQYVKVLALNKEGQEILVEGSDFLARALCHEIDHLDGILFDTKAKKMISVDDNR
ncbi:MAG: peptide deformylase [Peptostreptococcales bacterium]